VVGPSLGEEAPDSKPQGRGLPSIFLDGGCQLSLGGEGAAAGFAVRERVRWGKPGGLSFWFFWLMRGESLVLPRGEGESPLVLFFQRGGGKSAAPRGVWLAAGLCGFKGRGRRQPGGED